MPDCWCGSGKPARECCQPILNGEREAPTAQALMRSRYSAFVTENADYLRRSWHPATCPANIRIDPEQRWLGLKVISTSNGGAEDDDGEVTFVARYKIAGKGHRLEERSRFTRLGGRWVYVGRVVE